MTEYTQLSKNFHLITNFSKDRYKVEFNLQFTSGGAFFEKEGERGVSHLLEHCLLGRTEDKNFDQLKEYLFQENIYCNAATGNTSMYLTMSGHKKDSAKILDLITKFAFKPTLTKEIQDKEREIVLREISERSGDPSYRLYWEMIRQIFEPGSKYLCEVLGSAEDVKNSDLKTFENIHARILAESHFILTVAGAECDSDMLQTKMLEYSKSNLDDKTREVNLNLPNKLKPFKFYPVISDLAHEHVELSIYLPCAVNLENRAIRYFVTELFFKFPEGYLYNRLRNELGWIYGLQTSFDSSLQMLVLELSCELKYVESIISEIREMFENFDKIFRASKISMIKNIFLKKQEMVLDEPQAIIDFTVDNFTDFGIPLSYAQYLEKISEVGYADIQKLYESIHSNIDKMQVVGVSKDKTLESVKI
jgi:predicted Zn-dependent peptidase